jgi:hypothetical protein
MKTIEKKSTLFLMLFLSIILSSCAGSLSGEVVKQERKAENFTGIVLAISGDVYLEQGEKFDVKIEADKDVIDRIETVVKDNILKIRAEKGLNLSWSNPQIKVFVTMPVVEQLSVVGSGDIKAVSRIEAKSLEASVSGSGDVKIDDLKVEKLSARVSGSGDIVLNGMDSAQYADIKVTGSGDISIQGVKFKNAEVSITGSGDSYLMVTEELTARIVGSGDISYSGRPLVDAKITGSGRIKER